MSLASNKKAHFEYELLETLECGIELLGHEVKSVRKGSATLDGARALIRGGELYVVGLHIPPYQPKNTDESYDPARTRRLLARTTQIAKMESSLHTKGLTLIPVSLYNKGTKIKVELAIARGKKKADKRESIKKRETDREIRRVSKERR